MLARSGYVFYKLVFSRVLYSKLIFGIVLIDAFLDLGIYMDRDNGDQPRVVQQAIKMFMASCTGAYHPHGYNWNLKHFDNE